MSGFLFDTSVLLDLATADNVWLAWSEQQLRTAAAQGPLLINPIIYAELALVENFTLVIRDVARYRTYFPSLRVIAP